MSSDGENVKRQDRATDEATETPVRPAPNLSADHNTAVELNESSSDEQITSQIEAVPTGNANAQPEPDPFDLANLRLDQSFVESAGVKKLLTTVPVRKPNPQSFVRVHPDTAYRSPLAVIDLKEDYHEMYLVPPPIAHELPGEFVMVTLFTAIDRQGTLFLWPVRLPTSDGRINDWNKSLEIAADLAMKRWVRVKANMGLRAYEIFEAASTIPDPKWPELSFNEILRTAFRDRFVDSLDHAIIKRLRGLT